jgi:hypothetical protein
MSVASLFLNFLFKKIQGYSFFHLQFLSDQTQKVLIIIQEVRIYQHSNQKIIDTKSWKKGMYLFNSCQNRAENNV